MPIRLGPLELRRRRGAGHAAQDAGEDARLAYTCNICGARQDVPAALLDRESISCLACESNVRFRAIIHVLTVPYTLDEDCLEHYPGAIGYRVRRRVNQVEVQHGDGGYLAHDPVFHGGPGATLEMRRMSLRGVLGHLRAAGFERIAVRGEPALRFGVVHQTPFSLPITAYKPATP